MSSLWLGRERGRLEKIGAFVSRPHLLLVCCMLLATGLAAQIETGSLGGTVRDPSKLPVVKANVSLHSEENGAEITTLTDDVGVYQFPSLKPGAYLLSVRNTGMAEWSQHVIITVGARSTANVALVLGIAETKVEVVADGGVEVNTQSQELSSVVTAQKIVNLATLTRNPYDLTAILPNVSGADPNTLNGTGVGINGQRSTSTDIMLDGAENVDYFNMAVGQTVPLDSVQEFRVTVSDFTAEYGRASGGIVDVITKSGNNQFHGTAYEFNRVSTLTALEPNALPSPFTRNQFGYSIGGPIIRNKLFFFQSTEWTRVRSAILQKAFVPTPEFIAASAGNTQDYFDHYGDLRGTSDFALTKDQVVAAGGFVPNPGGLFDQLPGSLPIFQHRVAVAPVDTGGGLPQNAYSLVGRLDLNLSQRTTIAGRYALTHEVDFDGTINSSPYDGYASGQTLNNSAVTAWATHTFTPNLIAEWKAGFSRINSDAPLGRQPVSPSLGFNFALPGLVDPLVLPGYQNASFSGPRDLYQFVTDVSYKRGRHLWRLGGEYIYRKDDIAYAVSEFGTGAFGSSDDTAGGLDGFMAGQLYSYTIAIDPQGKVPCVRGADGISITPECSIFLPVASPVFARSVRTHEGALYVQDAWHVLPRLTLNLGLRWEYYGIPHNGDPNLDSNFYNGSGKNVYEQIRNGQFYVVPKSPLGSFYRPDYRDFGPRLGVAWDVFGDGKTSVRGGYGIGYEHNWGNSTFNVFQNPPNYAVLDVTAGIDVPEIPVTTDNFGALAANTGSVPLYPLRTRQIDENLKTAYAEFWSASLQRQLLANTVLSVSTSGSRGHRLYELQNVDRAGSGAIYLGDQQTQGRHFPRINNQYTNIENRGNDSSSNYNALLAEFSSSDLLHTGLSIDANYTWSHSIDDISNTFGVSNAQRGYLDPFQPELDRGNSNFDLRHQFVLSGIWEEPGAWTGRHGPKGYLLGGWTIAPVFRAHSGVPFTVLDCGNALTTCPRYIPSETISLQAGRPTPAGAPNLYNFLNLPAAVIWADPILGLGDFPDCTGVSEPHCRYPAAMTGRNAFRFLGSWNLDMGVYKSIPLGERCSLQLRGEFFNVFNHKSYALATGSVADSFTYSGGTEGPFTLQANKVGHRNVQLAAKFIF